MTFGSVIVARPLFIFFLLTIGVLLIPSIVIPWWYKIIQQMKEKVDMNAHMFHSGLMSEIDGLVNIVDRSTKVALILLVVLVAAVFISILSFVLLMIRAATREIHLCSALIKQMEATQQAERKSMNKSIAFASASHDIRTALAGISGLIEICFEGVSRSELQANLQQMNDCAKDLVGLLNSILDTSKIEAGKMQVEFEEFDLDNLLEDVVDLFHPVAMKKGVDVVLDPCDGSALKFSSVKGDRGKLKQVLCNLLSNAVKFTSEGHVSVRAWAQKPSLENKIIASSQKGMWTHCTCWFMEHKEDNDAETMNSMKQNPNCMEFVFEVDDTGTGIPKERRKLVFENFVQVKETAFGQGGTGLGLGIVQSLVRLMGGEITIVDKDNNEKGTCFKFNTFLITSEIPSTSHTGDIEMGGHFASNNTIQYSELTVKAPTPSLTSCAASPRLSMLVSSPKTDGSHVILLIQNIERRRIVQKFIESLGIRVSVVNKWEHLSFMLRKIKSKQNISHYSSSGNSDFGSRNEISSSRSKKDVPLSALEGSEQKPTYHRSSSMLKGAPSFILLVIDTNAGPFEELHEAVTEFKRGLRGAFCKVVWLNKPTFHSFSHEGLEYNTNDSDDEIFLKPFHGSRLYKVIKFLPEFGGTLHQGLSSTKSKKESASQRKKNRTSSAIHTHSRQRSGMQSSQPSVQEGNLVAEGSSRREKHKTTMQYLGRRDSVGSSEIEEKEFSYQVEEKEYNNQRNEKPLSGVRFLVAEDTKFLRDIAEKILSQLGASVQLCQNGEEALQLVRFGLQEQRKHGGYPEAPYDYILMDCEMPIMNGYEATRQIRMEERSYDIHIPIIALTADDDNGEKTKEAGMDYHLCKPLHRDKLLEAIGINTSI